MIYWILVALIFAIPQLAMAQQRPIDIATDQELFAGYCLGAEQQAATTDLVTGNPSLDEPIKKVREAQMTRLRGYLQARGFGAIQRDLVANQGVILSIARGKADVLTCNAHIESCVQECQKVKPYTIKCATDCRDLNLSCHTISRCYNDNMLPF